MSINLYKKKTINNQPVLEELLSKSTDTVDNKPLVYDSTTDNVKSADDLCVNTVTANCFCGKATCADIADVACTVCVNGVSGPRPILTLGSDGKVHNTGDSVLAGSESVITPYLITNYILPASDNQCTIELYNGIYNDEYARYENLTNVCYTPFSCLFDLYDCTCCSRICIEKRMRDTDGPSINGIFCSKWACTYSCFGLNKNFTCYHRSDPINKICSTILTSCAGHIFLDTCKWDYGENILGQGCLCLDICNNTLYSKSCLNNQYNYLIQDCNGTCICSCRRGSTYCPATLQVCFNGIKTNAKNNIAESYLSEKPNSFMLHTCDTTNCKTGSIEVDSDSGYILHCTQGGNCGRVNFSQDGVTFIQDNVSSTIIGDQFSGNAATATNADNSTCFNNCTYSEACIDIRDGLATQACANAIQNCADFIQSCVTAIENKIPAQASASNQLADKEFVNSSITTNTANFRGTYACVADLPSTGNTNNDYAFVCSLNTTTGNYVYDRYKWVASNSCWVCEYELNTTGFTAEQLASINSGITDTLVAKITDVYDNTVTLCMNGACKGSFNLNQNTDACIDLGCTIQNATCFDGCTYACAKADIRNYTPSLATNSTCFGGCTYACAKADIRNYTPGLATNATCFNGCTYACAKADIRSGLTGCTGTVTSVNVSVNGCSGTAVTTSGTVTLTNVPTCKIYKTMATANTNRNVLLGEASETAGYGCVYVGNSCKLTFNPSTGVLCAKCFCGSVTASGQIDCSIAIKRYQATTGDCHIALFNGNTAINDACAYVSSVCPLTFNPSTGVLNTCTLFSDTLDSCNIRADSLVACSSVYLGDECDICIYDRCGHPFICGYNCSLTIGYGSGSFMDSDCCRITVGLDNCMCLSGNNCGESVVIGVCNKACWTSYDYVSIIYGCSNVTRDGGLAVGSWNYASGACSVVLGWDSNANSFAIAIGCDACAGNLSTIAIGNTTCATANGAIAIGLYAQSCISNGLAIGSCSYTCSYSTACVNSNIRKGPLREITITWCDSTLKCDIWKAIANNIDLRKNGKGTVLTSGCTYLSATGYIGSNKIPIYACNYNYNSSLATMCSIVVRDSGGSDIMTLSATCTAVATDAAGGGFLTITGWAK